MRPGVVLLGFVLGSAGAITFSLTGVVIIYLLLQAEHPRLAGEIGPLLAHWAIFVGLTVVAAVSFYGELRQWPGRWRWASKAGLAAALAAVFWFYWPD